MSYTVPTFNLTANILRMAGGIYLFVASTPANLAMGRRMGWQEFESGTTNAFLALTPSLLVPAGTDVRDASCGGDTDVIECPAGTGRWYQASGVDDIGKGFPNEHRCVTLIKVGWLPAFVAAGLGPWPAPIP